MKYTMSISPDFSPSHIAGWYIFNTWLQLQLSQNIHLALFDNFQAQRQAIDTDEIDIIYASPFDAAMLVRDKGFTAIAKPKQKPDETIISVAADSPITHIETLSRHTRIAKTDDPEVNMIGMIMLEPANLNRHNTYSEILDTHVLVAKRLFQNQADIGFFLKASYDDLSGFIKQQLRILVSSQIHIITHSILISPHAKSLKKVIQDALLNMSSLPKGQGVLDSMGIPAWEIQTQEDAEFMIDLMDTLHD
jgi:phosphonate transport system substrate-binding protein